ncbi:hypothetical protein DJ73_07270 [Halorubrum sp. Ea1]|nr:hypothetical protein DJ73_07270 [Halorubrum sp. Ea1]
MGGTSTAAGGGGSGYYGGGGGVSTDSDAGGGGGASSYTDGFTTTTTDQANTSSGREIVISYQAPPDAPTNLSASTQNSDEIFLNWSSASNADSYRVYRSTSSGVDTSDTLVGTPNGTSFTDGGLNDGTTYRYRVSGVNSVGESELSNEASDTTTLPAPTNPSVTSFDDDSATLSWSASHDNGNTLVQYRPDGGSYQTATTVSQTTETASILSLLNGQQYDARVVANTTDASSASGTNSFTTTLPDEDQPILGNGVEDEVAVDRETESANNGSVRYQIRETGEGSWDGTAVGFGEFIGPFDTVAFEFVGREDGERYEVRGRTETTYRTGAWTTPITIITQFPGANSLAATAVDETTTELAWTDDADNENGQEVIRELRRPDGSWGRDSILEDVGPNTESYTDNTVQPNREYQYRIRSYTQYTSAESNFDTATTPALNGVRDRRVPPTGWLIEVEHPSGDTLTPTVLEGAEWHPRLNGQPEIRVPVPRSSTWEDHDVEGSTVRAWTDGTRLPIDELQTVERDETRNVLVAVGGTALEDDVDGIEYPEKNAHIAAEEVITQELGWVANVDDPQTSAREDVRLFQASDSGDFTDGIEGSGNPFPATSPLTVENNEVFAEPTGWFREAEDADGSGLVNTTQGGEWSGGGSVNLQSGDRREVEFTLAHTIPEGEAQAVIVYGIPPDSAPGLEFTRTDPDGSETVVESFGEGGINDTGGQFQLDSYQIILNTDGDLTPGSYSLEVQIPVTSGGELYFDFAHVRDDRYPIDQDITPVDGVVTGWQQRPADIDVVFEPITSVEQVVAGQVDVTLAGGGAPEALALRNDQTAAWSEATDTTSFATDFADATQLIQARVTLGREDSGSQSGQFGDQPQRLDFLNLFGDLVNTPVLLDFVHRGTIEELLNRIADAGDFIWELRRAPNADAEYRIEWTQPGQRLADAEPTLVSFSGQRSIDGSYQRVIAEGKTSSIEGETFTANDYGLNVGLGEGPVDTGSETVYDAGDRSTQYERGLDYVIGHSEGTITILEGGSMTPGTQYEIDYEWRFEGSYTQPAVADPRTLRQSFPDATSDRECEQLALAVVREVAAPLEEAEVTIRETDPSRSLVTSIPADELPFEGPLEVRDISNSAREVTLTLGSRESVGDIVDNLRDRLSAVARNV